MKAFFTWYINTECNYRCSYCKPEQLASRRAPAERWIAIWEDIYQRYGACHISFSGGEPFVYPGFVDLLASLSQRHTMEVITNLSFDVEPLISRVDLSRLRMGCSFHPESADFEDFLGKMRRLKAQPFESWVTVVAYPKFLKDLLRYKRGCDEAGVRLSLLPFNGAWDGRQYPQGYTQEERALVLEACGDDEVNRKAFAWNGGQPAAAASAPPAAPGPRACLMGGRYARIYPDGRAQRCCAAGAESLGNLLDGTFRLLEQPSACSLPACPCWKRMTPGDPERWQRYWVVPYTR